MIILRSDKSIRIAERLKLLEVFAESVAEFVRIPDAVGILRDSATKSGWNSDEFRYEVRFRIAVYGFSVSEQIQTISLQPGQP